METPLRIGIPVSNNVGDVIGKVNNSNSCDCSCCCYCGKENQKNAHKQHHVLQGGFVHRPEFYCLCCNTNTSRDSLIYSHQDQPQCLLHSQQEDTGFLLTTSPLSMSTCCALSSATPSTPGRWPKWPRSRIKDLDEGYSPSGISLSSASSSPHSSSYGSNVNTLGRKCHQGRGIVVPSLLRKVSFRFFQIAIVLTCILCIYTLVDNIVNLAKSRKDSTEDQFPISPQTFRDHLQSWIIDQDSRPSSSSYHYTHFSIANTNRLLNIQDFHLHLNNASMCKLASSSTIPPTSNSKHFDPDEKTGTGVYFMILVHSAPDHFEERQAIRSTWGSVKSLKSLGIRLVFLLGAGSDSSSDKGMVQSPITLESLTFGDIVSGSFVDTYRNLTYKHLMGYKWALTYCPGATFILKTDDDVFIDIFQLFDFTTRTYGYKPLDTLVCNVFPEGTKPVRVSSTSSSSSSTTPRSQEISTSPSALTAATATSSADSADHDHHNFQLQLQKLQNININTTTKWTVTQEEYPYGTYPKYCGGLAYLSTPDLLRKILLTSDNTKLFWIDDVFVTGILRELVGVEPFYLNLRFSYEPEEYRKWLDDRQPHHRFRKIPFMIVHVERGPKYSEEMSDLWRKTLQVWSS